MGEIPKGLTLGAEEKMPQGLVLGEEEPQKKSLNQNKASGISRGFASGGQVGASETPSSITESAPKEEGSPKKADYFKPLMSESGLAMPYSESPSYTPTERSLILETMSRFESNPIYKDPKYKQVYFEALAQQGIDVEKVGAAVDEEAGRQKAFNIASAPLTALSHGVKALGKMLNPRQNLLDAIAKGGSPAEILAGTALSPVKHGIEGTMGVLAVTPPGAALVGGLTATEEFAPETAEKINTVLAPMASRMQKKQEETGVEPTALEEAGASIVDFIYQGLLFGGAALGYKKGKQKFKKSTKDIKPEDVQAAKEILDLKKDSQDLPEGSAAKIVVDQKLQDVVAKIDELQAEQALMDAAEIPEVTRVSLLNQTRESLLKEREQASESGKKLIDENVSEIDKQIPREEKPLTMEWEGEAVKSKGDADAVQKRAVEPVAEQPSEPVEQVVDRVSESTDAVTETIKPETDASTIEKPVDVVSQEPPRPSEQVAEGVTEKLPEPPKEEKPIGSESSSDVGTSQSGEVKKTIVTKRAYEGKFRQAVKKELEDIGLTREEVPHEKAEKQAQEVVAKVGIDTAMDAVRNGDIEGGAAAEIFNSKLEALEKEMLNEADPVKLSELAKEQAELLEELGTKAMKGGQFSSQFAHIYQKSTLGYNVEQKITQFKAQNKGEIPAEVEANFRELDRQLQEVKKQLAQAEERAKKAEEELSIANIKEENKRAKKKNIYGKTRVAKGLDDLASALNVTTSAVGDRTPQIRKALIEIGQGLIEEGLATLENVSAKIKDAIEKKFGDKVKYEQYENDVMSKLKKDNETDGKLRIPVSLLRDLVERGIDNIEDLTKAVMTEMQKDNPDITEREVRDAITGYGKTLNLNQEQVATQLRKMKRVGRIISAMEDVQRKKRPLKSGIQRDKLDAQERALNKELREAMKELPLEEADLERQLKVSLDAAKTRLKNAIEDIHNEIDSGQKRATEKPSPKADAEIRDLQEQLNELREVRDAIFDKNLNDAEKIRRSVEATERAIEKIKKKIEENDLEIKKSPKETNPEKLVVRERLKKANEILTTLRDEVGVTDKQRIEQAKERSKEKVADLERRLREGDFSKKKKVEITPDNELTKLRAEQLRIQGEYDKAFYKNKLENRSSREKWGDRFWGVWGLTRALRATAEWSFVGVQGLSLTIRYLLRNPRKLYEAFANAGKQMFSERKTEKFLNEIKSQEYYPDMKKDKLSLTEPHAELTAREELFVSDWANMIWNTALSPIKLINKKAYERVKKASPFKAFERAAVGYLDTLRVYRYLEGKEMLERNGITRDKNPEAYKQMADVVNTFTGRGSVTFGGNAPKAANILTKIFFSPKLWSSAIKTSTPYAFYHFGKMRAGGKGIKPTVQQKMALMDFTTQVALTTSMVMLAKAYFDNDDDPATSVELDPTSSDFMKLKMGDTRVDPWGGKIQQVIMMSKILADSVKKTSGKHVPLGTKHQTPTAWELLIEMSTNKLSPSARLLQQYLDKETKPDGTHTDNYGNPYNLTDELKNNLYPIYWETIQELAADGYDVGDALLTFYAFFGGGVSTYEKKESTLTPEQQKKVDEAKAKAEAIRNTPEFQRKKKEMDEKVKNLKSQFVE